MTPKDFLNKYPEAQKALDSVLKETRYTELPAETVVEMYRKKLCAIFNRDIPLTVAENLFIA